MAPKKKTYPSLFCEWVVGMTIPTALGPIPKKPPRRQKVVKVEVLTDNETDEEILKITYPRPRRSKTAAHKAKVIKTKKVRFQGAPKRSAMKQATSSASEDEEDEEEEHDDETDARARVDVESTDSSSITSDDSQPSRKTKTKKHKKAAENFSESEDDSESDSTCACGKSNDSRKRSKKQRKRYTRKPETSDSETDETPKDRKTARGKKGKGKKNAQPEPRGKGRRNETESSATDTESAKDTEDESDDDSEEEASTKKKDKRGQNTNKNAAQTEGKGSGPAQTDTSENKKEMKKKKKKKKEKKNKAAEEAAPGEDISAQDGEAKEATDKTPDALQTIATDDRKPGYPAGFPGPDARRPNFMEPPRTQVFHAEPVYETPEDPPLNTYYDLGNNASKTYRPSLYGRPLYPMQDPRHPPPPVGLPSHLYQNPYYYGFEHDVAKGNLEHVPATQGMPIPTWSGYYPPPHAYAGYPATSMPQPGALHPLPATDPSMPTANKSKGAFSTPAASSKDQDIAGGNNVLPPAKANPYYPRKRSPFSNMGGSQRSASNNSPRTPQASEETVPSSDHQQQEQQKQQQEEEGGGQWDNSSARNQDEAPANAGCDNHTANQHGVEQNTSSHPGQDTKWDNSWPKHEDTSAGAGAGDSNWGHQEAQNAASLGHLSPLKENNNVMPGGWSDPPATKPPSPWQDKTLAASTGGKVDW